VGAYGIPGDPAGMRALAANLRAQSAVVAVGSTRVDRSVDAIDYQGPAATRFRGTIGMWQFASAGLRSELEHLAALLEHEAARVAALQEQARREHERREREAREQAAKAGSGR
jgi:uncharacterized protein YukE